MVRHFFFKFNLVTATKHFFLHFSCASCCCLIIQLGYSLLINLFFSFETNIHPFFNFFYSLPRKIEQFCFLLICRHIIFCLLFLEIIFQFFTENGIKNIKKMRSFGWIFMHFLFQIRQTLFQIQNIYLLSFLFLF